MAYKVYAAVTLITAPFLVMAVDESGSARLQSPPAVSQPTSPSMAQRDTTYPRIAANASPNLQDFSRPLPGAGIPTLFPAIADAAPE